MAGSTASPGLLEIAARGAGGCRRGGRDRRIVERNLAGGLVAGATGGTMRMAWIFFCSSSRPWKRASGRGGQPGMYTSTGTILSTPLTTL